MTFKVCITNLREFIFEQKPCFQNIQIDDDSKSCSHSFKLLTKSDTGLPGVVQLDHMWVDSSNALIVQH